MTLREIVNRIEVLIRAILGEVLAGYMKISDVIAGKHSDLTDVQDNRTHEQIDEILDDLLENPNLPSHANSHAIGGSDPLTPSMIGAAEADHTHEWSEIAGEPAGSSSLTNYVNSLITAADPKDTETRLISGTVVWKSGLTYIASDLVYKILGKLYTAMGSEITLTEADANLSRIDTIYCDVYGNIGFITGTAANDPVKPTVSSEQLELSFAVIAPGALEPSNVSIEKIYDENSGEPDEWTAIVASDSGIAISADSATTPENGVKNIKIDIAIPDTTVPVGQRFIGEEYQGGIIFWIDTTGKKGLIAAKQDLATAAYQTGSEANNTQNNQAIGFGMANTLIMMGIAKSNQSGMAAPLCRGYSGGGYADWFLPSKEELYTLWFNRNVVGGFAASGEQRYWASTEAVNNSATTACATNFRNGAYNYVNKGTKLNIRPVRAFDDTALLPTTTPVDKYAPGATKITFTNDTKIDITQGIISFWLKSSDEWLTESSMLLELYNGANKVGSTVMSAITSLHGYKSSVDTWQQVAIMCSSFAPLSAQADRLTIAPVSNWKNNVSLQIDDIRAQYGTMITPEEPITADSGLRCGEESKSGALSYTIPFSKPMLNTGYDIIGSLKIIDSEGYDIGYESVVKTETGFTVNVSTTEAITIHYQAVKYQ